MIVVLCFADKTNMQAYRSRRCVGPFPDFAAVYAWLEKEDEHHWVTVEMEEPK